MDILHTMAFSDFSRGLLFGMLLDAYQADDRPVGFITWDPRNLPGYVQIGHNCIIHSCRGLGLGKAQLGISLQRILLLQPEEIRVRTGNTPFFLPARRMYVSAGFTPGEVVGQDHPYVAQVIDYVIDCRKVTIDSSLPPAY